MIIKRLFKKRILVISILKVCQEETFQDKNVEAQQLRSVLEQKYVTRPVALEQASMKEIYSRS